MKHLFTKIIMREQYIFAKAKEYIVHHVHEIFIFVCIFFLFTLLLRLPYINIFIPSYLFYFLLVVIARFIFQINTTRMIGMTICIFGILFLVTLTKNETLSENIGNLIYFMLWFDALLVFIDIRKELWKK